MSVKKTILCVDDEQSLSLQKLTLETRGYRVVTCSTALQAMNVFGNCSVDLVMSSMQLPDASGDELVGHLKSLAPEIPVILLSSHARNFHTDAPVDLLLRKGSFAQSELLDRIRLLLTKKRGPRRAVPVAAVNHAVNQVQAC